MKQQTKFNIDFRAGTTPEQDKQWILYTREIFGAIRELIEEPSTVASNTTRLRIINQLALIGQSDVVEGVSLGDFRHPSIMDWIDDIEAGRHF